MFRIRGRLWRKVRTMPYPGREVALPNGYMGLPVADVRGCDRCGRCVESCPASCLALVEEGLQMDLGACIFCGECARACPDRIVMGKEFELASRNRGDLKVVFRHG